MQKRRAPGRRPASSTLETDVTSRTCSVPISLGDRSYPIVIGRSLLNDPSVWTTTGKGGLAAIVSNATVAPLYAKTLEVSISGQFSRVIHIELPDGEQHKTLSSLNLIFDSLVAAAADRGAVLFALGGGVVGDITGFAASTYMRGVPFVQVPTTLLSQVDSSVGGKTAVNHPLGKNLIGTFYQPRLVVADLDTLRTLPRRELSAGLAEVIKYGPIMDGAFVDWLEGNIDALLALDLEALAYAVKRSCELKAEVVAGDERESGRRAILNFGHTFGHAIEAGMGYGAWLHGEAVGCGMVMALELSRRLGLVSDGYVRRVTKLISRAGLPTRGPRLAPEQYLEAMRHDKKSERGQLRFVVIEENGGASVRDAPDELVREVIVACCD